MRIQLRFQLLTLLLLLLQNIFAQKTLPPSLSNEYQSFFAQKNSTPDETLPVPDIAAAKAEDDQQIEQARFATPVLTSITTLQKGNWTELPDHSWVWRCRIHAPGALALVVLFEQLKMPEGGELFVFDQQQRRIIGPVQKQNLTESGKYTIGTIPGDDITLEYHAPPFSKGQESININRVDYAYHLGALADGDPWAADDFGNSLQCNVNVNCPEGAAWQTQKKGVARILMVFQGGSAWCSGTLIANTGGTGIPYFLTAHHCQILLPNPMFDQWAFDFNYEFAGCTNLPNEPSYQNSVGCQRMAWREETDFMLLKLNSLPNGANAYFNGWSRATTPAATSAFIHHPQGDVKKFSADNGAAVSHPNTINWGTGFGISPVNSHWKVVPDIGIYQPGSSGCPMFNNSKLVVGQLHGGSAVNCNVNAAYFGMFHISWDQGTTASSRLKDWLDPGNTNANTQAGYDQPPAPATISGNIQSWWGVPLRNNPVVISGSTVDTVMTDSLGNYIFNNITPGLNYTITPLSKNDPLNGVNAFDLILISRHILNLEPLTPAWKLIAADANESNTITTFDNVDTRKILLGTAATFPNQRSWRFFPANATFADPANPFANMPASSIQVNNVLQSVTGVNFFGVKLGDVDSTSDPASN